MKHCFAERLLAKLYITIYTAPCITETLNVTIVFFTLLSLNDAESLYLNAEFWQGFKAVIYILDCVVICE